MLYLISETEFQYVPPRVDSDDLIAINNNQQLTLMTQDINSFNRAADYQRFSKKNLWQSNCTVVGLDNSLYGIYKGRRQQCELSFHSETEVVVKVAQDFQTHEFLIAKIHPAKFFLAKNEQDILLRLNRLVCTAANQQPFFVTHYSQSKYSYYSTFLTPFEKGRDLHHYVDKKISFVLLLDVARQCALAMDELQEKHRILLNDFKLENVIYTCDGLIKLIDFAYASDCVEPPLAGAPLGTPGFVPPEYARKRTDGTEASNTEKHVVRYTKAAQMYAYAVAMMEWFDLGSVDYSLFNIHDPELFISHQHDKQSEKFVNNTRIPAIFMRHLIFDFLESALQDNPDQRPTFAKAVGFFTTLISHLSASEKIIKIGIVDFNEFDEALKNDTESSFLDYLKKYDVVWFFDSMMSENRKADYAKSRLILEKNNIRAVNTVLHVRDNQATQEELLDSLPPFFARKFPDFTCQIRWVRADGVYALKPQIRSEAKKVFNTKFKPGKMFMKFNTFGADKKLEIPPPSHFSQKRL